MKQYENALHQKLNTFADWTIRIIMINFMMILCALPIITLYPALLAGYKLFNDYLNKKETPLFRGFFKYFIENFGSKMQMGLLMALTVIMAIINLTVYNDYIAVNPSPMNLIGYYVMIILIVSALFVTFYTLPLLSTYPKTKTWLLIKFAFFLSGKYIFRTVLAVLILLVPILMMLTPVTMIIFLFTGVSVPVILYALLFKKVVKFIESLAEENA